MSHTSSTRTYTINSKLIQKFESIVPSGQKSKVIQELIAGYVIKNKNIERRWISPQPNTRKTKHKQGDST